MSTYGSGQQAYSFTFFSPGMPEIYHKKGKKGGIEYKKLWEIIGKRKRSQPLNKKEWLKKDKYLTEYLNEKYYLKIVFRLNPVAE